MSRAMSSTFAEDSVGHVNNCGLRTHKNNPAYTKSQTKSVKSSKCWSWTLCGRRRVCLKIKWSFEWFGWGLWSSVGPPCCPTSGLAALLHGACAAFLLLWRGGRTEEHGLGTVVLSGVGNLQCMPALVMYPDCGSVWHGQSSVCTSPSRTQTVVLSGMGSLHCVRALIGTCVGAGSNALPWDEKMALSCCWSRLWIGSFWLFALQLWPQQDQGP